MAVEGRWESLYCAASLTRLFPASTSGTDSDWVVKLIDVFPGNPSPADPTQPSHPTQPATPSSASNAHSLTIDPSTNANPSGFELMIADEIFRGRYRLSRTNPEPIPANTPEEYRFSLHAADHVFLQGHRIMVQIQST